MVIIRYEGITMLEKEFQYYLKNEKEFLEKYPNQYVMIQNENLIGVYPSEDAAYYDMINKVSTSPVLVQQCTSSPMGRTSLFN